jgi:hypothetical protein
MLLRRRLIGQKIYLGFKLGERVPQNRLRLAFNEDFSTYDHPFYFVY